MADLRLHLLELARDRAAQADQPVVGADDPEHEDRRDRQADDEGRG